MPAQQHLLVRIASVVAMSAILTSCSTIWDKPGITETEFNKDSYECQRDARMAHASFGGGLAGSFGMQAFAEQCMEARGYRKRR